MITRWAVRKINGWWTVSRNDVIVTIAPTRELAERQGQTIALMVAHAEVEP